MLDGRRVRSYATSLSLSPNITLELGEGGPRQVLTARVVE